MGKKEEKGCLGFDVEVFKGSDIGRITRLEMMRGEGDGKGE